MHLSPWKKERNVIALRRVPFTPALIPFSGYLYQMTDMLYVHADVKHETPVPPHCRIE
jgi:hypothetical protein